MEINFINFIFINFILITVIFGSLINLVEAYMPIIVIQSIRFGKHSYKGHKNVLVKYTEVPKAWYKHFYVFAMLWSLSGLFLITRCILRKQVAPQVILDFLNIVVGGGHDRQVLVDSTSALIAMFLLTIQCCRRCYETLCVQIFSSKNKMNFSQYLVGYIHYFGAVIAILSNTEGIVYGFLPSGFKFAEITIIQFLCVLLFLYAWLNQYKSNIILANLRKDTTGKVTTEKHLLPVGGHFETVSSPHMLFEVLMYVAILGIIPSSLTWRYVTLWVISNQTETAWLTHKWYKENFKSYPASRAAIYPWIL